jgi:hypothetical protein
VASCSLWRPNVYFNRHGARSLFGCAPCRQPTSRRGSLCTRIGRRSFLLCTRGRQRLHWSWHLPARAGKQGPPRPSPLLPFHRRSRLPRQRRRLRMRERLPLRRRPQRRQRHRLSPRLPRRRSPRLRRRPRLHHPPTPRHHRPALPRRPPRPHRLLLRRRLLRSPRRRMPALRLLSRGRAISASRMSSSPRTSGKRESKTYRSRSARLQARTSTSTRSIHPTTSNELALISRRKRAGVGHPGRVGSCAASAPTTLR